MIKLTRVNGETFFLNSDKIEYIDEGVESVISTESGRRFVVLESPEDIIEAVIVARRRYYGRFTAE
ncbi:MAG: flagellar FlbD family protein [Oscillospiraceae bacterium]|jgi:flagellar protein FlbD|nr:flagellar FlbD family protein [Oscillospiraceae bacterium]